MKTSQRRFRVVMAHLAAIALVLVPAWTAAEGQGGRQGMTSTANRVYGADFIKPVAGGLITVGGANLRYLPPGGRRWTNVISVRGHMSRVGLDDEGARIMAVWEQEPTLHLIGLKTHRHSTLALPPLGSADAEFLYVHSLSFAPDGADALVYMSGPAKNKTKKSASQAWRVRLDWQGTPQLLWDVHNSGELLWTCGRGALYILPINPEERFSWQSSLTGAFTAMIPTAQGMDQKVVYYDVNNKFQSVRMASGCTADRILGLVTTGRGGYGFITYHWGDEQGVYQEGIPGPGPSVGPVLAKHTDEMAYVVDRGRELDIVRRGLPPVVGGTSTPLWSPSFDVAVTAGSRTLASHVLGLGFRTNGTLWVQLGDDMALIGADGAVRHVRLEYLAGPHPEWTGSVYLEQPEGLWLGVEIGAGRDWVWAPFADMERRAKPWPARRPYVPPVGNLDDRDLHRLTKCLPPETRIACPQGEVRVADLKPGDPVWTRNRRGDRVAVTVLRVGRVPTSPGHRVIRLGLADGRTVAASTGHPIPGGVGIEALHHGEVYDGSPVRTSKFSPFQGVATFDLLPAGETGVYWANGIPLASTLTPE